MLRAALIAVIVDTDCLELAAMLLLLRLRFLITSVTPWRFCRGEKTGFNMIPRHRRACAHSNTHGRGNARASSPWGRIGPTPACAGTHSIMCPADELSRLLTFAWIVKSVRTRRTTRAISTPDGAVCGICPRAAPMLPHSVRLLTSQPLRIIQSVLCS
jgi:hypothetical protein